MNAQASPLEGAVVRARAMQVHAAGRGLLNGIDLDIAEGEMVAIVGHNGAGKSTLLRAMTGMVTLDHGQLQVLDVAMNAPPSASCLRGLRARVAQVHQGLQLVARLSALDNVLIGGCARNPSPLTWVRRWSPTERRDALGALARVGVAWAADRRTDSLSGGERQKVAIARALHQRPRLLLADEPTASLDAQAADEIAALLREVAAERGAALVCVVHDLDLLPRLADRAIALRHGAIVADLPVRPGTPHQLKGLLA